MNTYFKILLFFFIQLYITLNKARVTENTICKYGYLVQMSNHYECKCNEGYVLINEDTCGKKVVCDKVENSFRACDEYAYCFDLGNKNNEKQIKCMCRTEYTLTNGVCVPNVCRDKVCGKGKCIVDPINSLTYTCSCNIGTILNQNKLCDTQGDTPCSLKCAENEVCTLEGNYYTCKEDPSSNGGGNNVDQPNTSYSIINGATLIHVLIVCSIFIKLLL
ncbi:28 kDa ookinete surface protein [Plasmodium sp. gorilla clade G3]|nr:28 kDa ookinete surface protein [Plasmodium sp. gorilla clade G3]